MKEHEQPEEFDSDCWQSAKEEAILQPQYMTQKPPSLQAERE